MEIMSTKSSGDASAAQSVILEDTQSIVVTKPPKCRIPRLHRTAPMQRGQKPTGAKTEPPARRGNLPVPSRHEPSSRRTDISPFRPNGVGAPPPVRSRPHSTESARPKSGRKDDLCSVKSVARPRVYVPDKERAKMRQRPPLPVGMTQKSIRPPPFLTVPLSQDTMKRFEEIAIRNGMSDFGVKETCDMAAGKLLSVDVAKLYNIPNKLVATCEQTLAKRKEIIDWFENLRQEERAISMNKLAKKVNEFTAENEMLNSTLQKVKSEFLKEISEIIECVRKSLNDTIVLQLRTEDMMYELTEMNAQNADLRKQIQTAENFKSPSLRHKLEEAEKELKEERCEKMLMKKRMARAEGQVKIGQERAEQLEEALKQAREQMWSLENTIQRQNEENQKLQIDFDQELNKLTESIRENTAHVEEIARAREKLQTEKEELEERLKALSENYSESLETMKEEVNQNIARLAETERKFEEEKAERQKLESKLEMLCAQVLESELRHKETLKLLQEKDIQLIEALNQKAESIKDLETTKQQFLTAKKEIEEHRDKLTAQNEAITEIENKFQETIRERETLEAKLRNELSLKDNIISELEQKQTLLEKQMQEGELKMARYHQQLNSLKDHLIELKGDFGDFENLDELRVIVTRQRSTLLEAKQENTELAEQLNKKEDELKETLLEFQEKIDQKDGLIKKLREKEEEQAKIIKLLRNNLEIRTEAENEFFTNQLSEKNTEIDALKATIDARKLQISQLEKIVLTLEDQVRKLTIQRRMDQEKIMLLEKTIDNFEFLQKEAQLIEVPSDNLDSLIRILEDELSSPFDSRVMVKEEYNKKNYTERIRRDKLAKFEAQPKNQNTSYPTERENMPTKIVMGNFVKKTYDLSCNKEQNKGDTMDRNVDCILDRKKAVTNMEPHCDRRSMRYENVPLSVDKSLPPSPKDQVTRNLHFYLNNPILEKRCKCTKMFKFAGHEL